MAIRFTNKQENESGINISPLIDMVFILLIFFIVTTVFVDEAGMKARTSEIGPITKTETVTFTLKEDGRVYAAGQSVGIVGVAAIVRNGMKEPNVPVMISVEENAPAGLIIRVMDEVKSVAPKASITLGEAAK